MWTPRRSDAIQRRSSDLLTRYATWRSPRHTETSRRPDAVSRSGKPGGRPGRARGLDVNALDEVVGPHVTIKVVFPGDDFPANVPTPKVLPTFTHSSSQSATGLTALMPENSRP